MHITTRSHPSPEGTSAYLNNSCTVGTVIYYPSAYGYPPPSAYDSALNQWKLVDTSLTGHLLSYGGEVWNLNEGFRYNPVSKLGIHLAALPAATMAAEAGGFLYGVSEAQPNAQRFFKAPISSIKRLWVKR